MRIPLGTTVPPGCPQDHRTARLRGLPPRTDVRTAQPQAFYPKDADPVLVLWPVVTSTQGDKLATACSTDERGRA